MGEIREFVSIEDGVRRAIPRFEPADGSGPGPVIVEALRSRTDVVAGCDRAECRRLVDEGRDAVARVDTRGTGASEGFESDEYPAQEQRDRVRLIDWCAARPWSTGRVGMNGTSCSGFNSLQVASEGRPLPVGRDIPGTCSRR